MTVHQERKDRESNRTRSEFDESALVKRARAGDRHAFSKLVDLFQGNIYRMVFHRVYSQMDAEDLTQEIFLKAFQNLDRLRDAGRFKPWLFKIALNRVRDFKRKMTVRNFLSGATDDGEVENVQGEVIADPEADRVLRRREFQRHIRIFLKDLSRREREIFVLKFIDELHIREIAEILNKSESTVKTHLYRAIDKFRNASDLIDFLQGGNS